MEDRNNLSHQASELLEAVRQMKAGKQARVYSAEQILAIYWGVKGDFVDFWDAFLWLVAFVFIELNVFEWRQEILQKQTASPT